MTDRAPSISVRPCGPNDVQPSSLLRSGRRSAGWVKGLLQVEAATKARVTGWWGRRAGPLWCLVRRSDRSPYCDSTGGTRRREVVGDDQEGAPGRLLQRAQYGDEVGLTTVSRPEVISSQISRSGSARRARASAARCNSPPDSDCGQSGSQWFRRCRAGRGWSSARWPERFAHGRGDVRQYGRPGRRTGRNSLNEAAGVLVDVLDRVPAAHASADAATKTNVAPPRPPLPPSASPLPPRPASASPAPTPPPAAPIPTPPSAWHGR